MRHGCDFSVHVQLERRHFIVEFDEDSEVLRIKERKNYDYGPGMSGVYNASYWVASSHVLGTGNTMPKRIIAAARNKLIAEERSEDAAP